MLSDDTGEGPLVPIGAPQSVRPRHLSRRWRRRDIECRSVSVREPNHCIVNRLCDEHIHDRRRGALPRREAAPAEAIGAR